jgi:hypothetical protein
MPKANLAFANINELTDVTGLDEYVTFLKHNSTNPNGIDGAIFESTVALEIKKGNVPESGDLLRISQDGIPGRNKIDTMTSNWAIQIKHKKTFPPNFSLKHITGGEATLRLIAEQATNARRRAILITNCPITASLQDLLDEFSISWVRVLD